MIDLFRDLLSSYKIKSLDFIWQKPSDGMLLLVIQWNAFTCFVVSETPHKTWAPLSPQFNPVLGPGYKIAERQ